MQSLFDVEEFMPLGVMTGSTSMKFKRNKKHGFALLVCTVVDVCTVLLYILKKQNRASYCA